MHLLEIAVLKKEIDERCLIMYNFISGIQIGGNVMKRCAGYVMSVIVLALFLTFCVSAECNHNFNAAPGSSDVISFSDGFHSYYCLNGCGSFGTAAGGYGERERCNMALAFSKAPTCTEEGKQVYMCTVCYNRTESVIPKAKHKYKRTRKLPTCTSGGFDLFSCTICNKSYTENICGPTSHISDGGIVKTLPTYSNNGIIVSSCRCCGKELSRKTIPGFIKIEENIATDKVNGLKINSVNATSVKLVWTESAGADNYRVYYSVNKKSWKSVSTKGTYITVNKLIPATEYYFKITASRKNAEGEDSSILSACTKPSKPSVTRVSSSKKSTAAIRWERLKNVNGYELEYTLKSFDDEKSVKKVKVINTCLKTIKKLKSGRKYRFRVRAYKTCGSKKIFGAYSKVKTLKIK